MAAPKIALRKLTELAKDPRNARTHSPAQIEQIAGSVRRFGWTNPAMAVDSTIYAGNGRYDAAALIYEAGEVIYMAPGKDHGGQALPAGTMPVIDCTGWNEGERAAYALGDNQIALNAGWDDEILKAEIEDLAAMDFDLGALGFDEAALDALTDDDDSGNSASAKRSAGTQADTSFQHSDQYGVIIVCKDEADQEQIYNELRDRGLNVRVVVV